MAASDFSELLPDDDIAFLKDKHPTAEVYRVGQEVHVLLPKFPLPEAYTPTSADLLIRLPGNYSDGKPDMFWTRQDVKLTSGAPPKQCEHREVPGTGEGVERYGGTQWQRWSRHMDASHWRPGVDGLRTYIQTIKNDLSRGI